MNIFNQKVTEKGFIDKKELLKYVTEEDIFEIVFGFKPKEYDYVTSPLREDKNPGCWFQYSFAGRLKFVDFGSQFYIKGDRLTMMDCFDVVQQYFKLPNLYQTLRFIKRTLIDGKDLPELPEEQIGKHRVEKSRVNIKFTPRVFSLLDKDFWFNKYEIFKENLIEDKVFPVLNYRVTNSKFGDYSVTARSLTYCYTDFESGNVKIYRPEETGKRRFLTNCNQNDIGGYNFLPQFGKHLIITKSYKDYRVLKNQGLTVVWFQNEGMYPTLEVLLPLCKRFKKVTVFFDNDKTGIEAAEKLVSIINSYIPNTANYIHLPLECLPQQIKDPSDFIYKKGRKQLIKFLSQNKLL